MDDITLGNGEVRQNARRAAVRCGSGVASSPLPVHAELGILRAASRPNGDHGAGVLRWLTGVGLVRRGVLAGRGGPAALPNRRHGGRRRRREDAPASAPAAAQWPSAAICTAGRTGKSPSPALDRIKVAVFYTKLHNRLLRPLLAAGQPQARTQTPQCPARHRPAIHALSPSRDSPRLREHLTQTFS
jgi:hypothetical protein